jgi:uncharacterized protein (TIGR02246 family)
MQHFARALIALLFLLASSALLPAAARAQVLPGGRGSSALQMQSGYAAYVRKEVDAVVSRLLDALNARDARKAAELYDPEAHLLTANGSLVIGRAAMRDRYERSLPRMRSVQFVLQSFVNSGDLAHIMGILRYDVLLSTGGAFHVDSPVSLALRADRFGWVIQSQSGGDLPAVIAAYTKPPERATAGDTLRITVRITDASGQNVSNVLVAFEGEAGGVAVRPGAVMTNAAGLATTVVTLGREPGLNVIRATASGLVGEPVFFAIRGEGVGDQ